MNRYKIWSFSFRPFDSTSVAMHPQRCVQKPISEWNNAFTSWINIDWVGYLTSSKLPFIRKWSIEALLVFAKNSFGVPRQWGTGAKDYVRSSCRSREFPWTCDFTKSVNARSLCFWNCTSFPCEVVSFAFLLAASIVLNHSLFRGPKKKILKK